MVGVNTNNGLERQNQVFKHSYLHQYKNNSLSGMLAILTEEFLPDSYNRYTSENLLQLELYLSAEGLEEQTCLGWVVLPIMGCTGGLQSKKAK